MHYAMPSWMMKTDQRPWWVYVLLCQNGRTYTGMALDVEKRYKVHLAGRGSVYTRINKPVCILAAHQYTKRCDASAEEQALKKADLYWVKRWCRNNLWHHSGDAGSTGTSG